MAKQFCYQDQWGVIYPEHPALRFEPSLVPGYYDTEKRVFTPVGNPKAQVGNIITDGDTGQVLSGLKEDKGANTAPVNGVIISQQEAVQKEEVVPAETVDSEEQVQESILEEKPTELEVLTQEEVVAEQEAEVITQVTAQAVEKTTPKRVVRKAQK